MRHRQHRHQCGGLGEASRPVGQWKLTACPDGSLRIQPMGPTLTYEDFSGLLDRVRQRRMPVDLREIVFDLERVGTFGPQWTTILAMLISFARGVAAHCRLASLHGQPSAVVSLYRSNREVASLLAGADADCTG